MEWEFCWVPAGNGWTDGSETGGRIAVKDRIFRHGILDMVLIFFAEYLMGTFLKSLGICPWDYTGRMLSIDGVIRLDFAPFWFMTGLLFEYLTGGKEGIFSGDPAAGRTAV